jgi:outer membrane protein assembly factor BamB
VSLKQLNHPNGRLHRTRLSILAAAIALTLASGCSGSSEQRSHFIDAPYPNVDAANTRYVKGPIREATVADLEFAWAVPLGAPESEFGSDISSPVVAGGIAYSQDQASTVQAIDLDSGDIVWEKPLKSPANGTNGATVAEGLVFAADKTEVFALDRQTGEEVWSVSLVRSDAERIEMAPGYRDGLVYVSTAPASLKGGEIGVLWALDAQTGKKVWSFDTVPKGLWGNPRLNYGGGTSYTPAFDGKGAMYIGVGSPGPVPGTAKHPWGDSRPGPNLYTSSVVKLDAKTGEVQWYYQLTPHGLCNWDVGSPVLVSSRGRDLVLATGLGGVVVALDRNSGKVVWKRSVGRHNGHDNDGLYAMRGEYSRLKTPMTVFPGQLGGVFSAVSTNRSTVFASVVNYATWLGDQRSSKPVGSPAGELVALDVASGDIDWKHSFRSPPIGPPTTVNDLVFATTLDGTLYAFNAANGGEVWSESLPAGINAGLAVTGDTLLAPAGYAEAGQTPELLAYRLG